MYRNINMAQQQCMIMQISYEVFKLWKLQLSNYINNSNIVINHIIQIND